MSRKKMDLDIEVLVQNNRRGILNYNDGRGALIELQEYGDEEYVSMRTLKSLSTGRNKNLLRTLSLIIIDVIDEEVTLEDVLAELRLTKYYDKAKEDIPRGHIFFYLVEAAGLEPTVSSTRSVSE